MSLATRNNKENVIQGMVLAVVQKVASSPEEVRPSGIQEVGLSRDDDVDWIIMEGRAGKVYDRRTDM